MKRASTSHTAELNQSVGDSKKCSSFILCQKHFLISAEKKNEKPNRFEYFFFMAQFFCQSKVKLSWKLPKCTPAKYNRRGVLRHFSTSAAVCLIQYGIVGPWRQTSVHQHAGDAFPHLGSVIIQAYNSMEVKSLWLISEAEYPLLAFFFQESSLPLPWGFRC